MLRRTGEVQAFDVSFEARAARFEIIGRSPVMQDLFHELKTVGHSDAAALVEGETGVGKDLIARALHILSPRSSRPFVALNAASLPEGLFERELFGHRRATPGIYSDQDILARAAGGTLFIDEVGELSLTAQAKLLCFLDQQETRPVEDARAVDGHLRLICGTSHDLRAAVKRKLFRQDLYYRLQVITLRIPSLRDRRDDIPPLAEHFLGRFCEQYGKTVAGFSPSAMIMLMEHEWEGNVRELQNVIEGAVIRATQGGEIPAETLSLEATLPTRDLVVPRNGTDSGSLLRDSRREAEQVIISKTLKRHRWNVSAAARELGISRVGLTRKLKRLGIHRPGTVAS